MFCMCLVTSGTHLEHTSMCLRHFMEPVTVITKNCQAQSLRKQTNNNVSITKTNFMVRTEASEISQYLNV